MFTPVTSLSRKVRTLDNPAWPPVSRRDQFVLRRPIECGKSHAFGSTLQEFPQLVRRSQRHTHGHGPITPRPHLASVSIVLGIDRSQYPDNLPVQSSQKRDHGAAGTREMVQKQYSGAPVRGIPKSHPGGSPLDL
jgi:hypothetical protein